MDTSVIDYLVKHNIPLVEWPIYLDKGLDEPVICPEGRWAQPLNEEDSRQFIQRWEQKGQQWLGKCQLAFLLVGFELYRVQEHKRGQFVAYLNSLIPFMSLKTCYRRMELARRVMWKVGILKSGNKPRPRHLVKMDNLLHSNLSAVTKSLVEIEEEEKIAGAVPAKVLTDLRELDPEEARSLGKIDAVPWDDLTPEQDAINVAWLKRSGEERYGRYQHQKKRSPSKNS